MPANNPEFKQNCKHVQILHVWKASLHDSENNLVGELTVKRSVRKVAKHCLFQFLKTVSLEGGNIGLLLH